MTIQYLETYVVLGRRYGIAKAYQWPERPKAKGFDAWSGGCGIGEQRPRDVCRTIVAQHAKELLLEAQKESLERLVAATNALQVFEREGIKGFMVENEKEVT